METGRIIDVKLELLCTLKLPPNLLNPLTFNSPVKLHLLASYVEKICEELGFVIPVKCVLKWTSKTPPRPHRAPHQALHQMHLEMHRQLL